MRRADLLAGGAAILLGVGAYALTLTRRDLTAFFSRPIGDVLVAFTIALRVLPAWSARRARVARRDAGPLAP